MCLKAFLVAYLLVDWLAGSLAGCLASWPSACKRACLHHPYPFRAQRASLPSHLPGPSEQAREIRVIIWLVAHVVGRLAGGMTWHCLIGWVAFLLRGVPACAPSFWKSADDRSSSWESRRAERDRERERGEMRPKREAERGRG